MVRIRIRVLSDVAHQVRVYVDDHSAIQGSPLCVINPDTVFILGHFGVHSMLLPLSAVDTVSKRLLTC